MGKHDKENEKLDKEVTSKVKTKKETKPKKTTPEKDDSIQLDNPAPGGVTPGDNVTSEDREKASLQASLDSFLELLKKDSSLASYRFFQLTNSLFNSNHADTKALIKYFYKFIDKNKTNLSLQTYYAGANKVVRADNWSSYRLLISLIYRRVVNKTEFHNTVNNVDASVNTLRIHQENKKTLIELLK